MTTLLLAALWVHLACSALLVGGFFMLLLAGPCRSATARRWDETVVSCSRVLVLVALGSGVVWFLVRTALFENRPQAALEARAVGHAVVDTWPGLVWLARHLLLVVLGAFLAIRADVAQTWDWIAARGEALALGTLALALMSASSHAAAITPGTASAVAIDITHLVGAALWIGGLVALALLLRSASGDAGSDARPYAVAATRRFSRAALIVMLLLMASGVLSALAQVESLAALAGTTHGRLLLAKLAVLVPILGLATVNRTRILPALTAPGAMRRLTTFVALEAALAFVLLALAAAMALTTPARHADPVWPLPFRLSLDDLLSVPATKWRALIGCQVAVLGVVALLASFLLSARRAPVLGSAVALITVGAGIGLPPLVVDAYPTTYRRPLLTYHATSIASGMAIYREHCAICHGAMGAGDGSLPLADLRSPRTSRRHAGELFWLISHGVSDMPRFDTLLSEAQRWDVINLIRAFGAANDSKNIGRQVDVNRAWLIAPDLTVAVGPLAPGALRDYRGRRIVLLVLYRLPESRARITELARSYSILSVMGVEVIAVPMHTSSDPIGELGASPPILFPVVTDGAADIATAYGILAPGPHAELLIDRQGYIRAIWRDNTEGLQAQVEKLNEERTVPPFPDDHVH